MKTFDSKIQVLYQQWLDNPEDTAIIRQLAKVYTDRLHIAATDAEKFRYSREALHWTRQWLEQEPANPQAQAWFSELSHQTAVFAVPIPETHANHKPPAASRKSPKPTFPLPAIALKTQRNLALACLLTVLTGMAYMGWHFRFEWNPFQHVPEPYVFVCENYGENHRFHHIGTCWALYQCSRGVRKIHESEASAAGLIHCKRCNTKHFHPQAAAVAGFTWLLGMIGIWRKKIIGL